MFGGSFPRQKIFATRAMNLAYSIFLLVTILLLISHRNDEMKRARESPDFVPQSRDCGAAGRELTRIFLNLFGALRSAFRVIRGKI
jgi:hypothetical protein